MNTFIHCNHCINTFHTYITIHTWTFHNRKILVRDIFTYTFIIRYNVPLHIRSKYIRSYILKFANAYIYTYNIHTFEHILLECITFIHTYKFTHAIIIITAYIHILYICVHAYSNIYILCT